MPTLNELKGNGTLPASPLSPEAESGRLLHGTRRPKFALETEKPWHRFAAYLFATGATTIKQVADACEVTEPTVRNLMRQDWFQARVTGLLAQNGGDDIMTLLKQEQFRSLVTLIEIRDDPKVSSAVRVNVARDILDRTLGKAKTRVEFEDKTPSSDDPVAEAHRLEQEVALSRQRS